MRDDIIALGKRPRGKPGAREELRPHLLALDVQRWPRATEQAGTALELGGGLAKAGPKIPTKLRGIPERERLGDLLNRGGTQQQPAGGLQAFLAQPGARRAAELAHEQASEMPTRYAQGIGQSGRVVGARPGHGPNGLEIELHLLPVAPHHFGTRIPRPFRAERDRQSLLKPA